MAKHELTYKDLNTETVKAPAWQLLVILILLLLSSIDYSALLAGR